jgi:hypothetical protein
MEINTIAKLLHTNNDKCNEIIKRYGLYNLIKIKNNGIISNILNYYINKNDDMINQILDMIDSLDNFELMKRDYLNLIKYFYNDNKKLDYYFDKIINKIYSNTDNILNTKDLNFLLKNNLLKIFWKLNGLFVKTSINYPTVNYNNLNLIVLDSSYNNLLLNKINKIIGIDFVNHIEKYQQQFRDFDYIVDGGNILYNKKGMLTNETINDLIKIINNYKSLVIIHKKNIKKYPELIQKIRNNNGQLYITPHGKNDDLYILWFFLKYNCRKFIISNDLYRDHIYNLETKIKNKNITRFIDIINQNTLKYDKNLIVESKPQYSKCIQVIDKNVYIPHINNEFILLKNYSAYK